jgi:hypothetical protein
MLQCMIWFYDATNMLLAIYWIPTSLVHGIMDGVFMQ